MTKTREKDPEKVEQAKALYEQRERRKLALARHEAAMALAAIMRRDGNPEGALTCVEYARITAQANKLF